jgi:hypothetical protein
MTLRKGKEESRIGKTKKVREKENTFSLRVQPINTWTNVNEDTVKILRLVVRILQMVTRRLPTCIAITLSYNLHFRQLTVH